MYYIVPQDAAIIDRLCEYLNSADVAEWLSEHCQRAANGFLRLQSNVLKTIPVPDDFGGTQSLKRSSKLRDSSPEPIGLILSEAADDDSL